MCLISVKNKTKKILKRWSLFKRIKISQFWGKQKPLEMGPDFWQFQTSSHISHFFDGEKSFNMGSGFGPLIAHPHQKITQHDWIPFNALYVG